MKTRSEWVSLVREDSILSPIISWEYDWMPREITLVNLSRPNSTSAKRLVTYPMKNRKWVSEFSKRGWSYPQNGRNISFRLSFFFFWTEIIPPLWSWEDSSVTPWITPISQHLMCQFQPFFFFELPFLPINHGSVDEFFHRRGNLVGTFHDGSDARFTERFLQVWIKPIGRVFSQKHHLREMFVRLVTFFCDINVSWNASKNFNMFYLVSFKLTVNCCRLKKGPTFLRGDPQNFLWTTFCWSFYCFFLYIF